MNDLRKFEKKVLRDLKCSRKAKTRAKAKLDQMIGLIDTAPERLTTKDLVDALGRPEEVVASLMDYVTEKDVQTYKTSQMLKQVCAVTLILAMLIAAIYVFGGKETPVEYDDKITVDEIITTD